MKTLSEIKAMPTVLSVEYIQEHLAAGAPTVGFHESLLRSFHVVEKVKELAAEGVPSKVILELVDEMTG